MKFKNSILLLAHPLVIASNFEQPVKADPASKRWSSQLNKLRRDDVRFFSDRPM